MGTLRRSVHFSPALMAYANTLLKAELLADEQIQVCSASLPAKQTKKVYNSI